MLTTVWQLLSPAATVNRSVSWASRAREPFLISYHLPPDGESAFPDREYEAAWSVIAVKLEG